MLAKDQGVLKKVLVQFLIREVAKLRKYGTNLNDRLEIFLLSLF